MPLVQEVLSTTTGGCAFGHKMDDAAVAYGAALYAQVSAETSTATSVESAPQPEEQAQASEGVETEAKEAGDESEQVLACGVCVCVWCAWAFTAVCFALSRCTKLCVFTHACACTLNAHQATPPEADTTVQDEAPVVLSGFMSDEELAAAIAAEASMEAKDTQLKVLAEKRNAMERYVWEACVRVLCYVRLERDTLRVALCLKGLCVPHPC